MWLKNVSEIVEKYHKCYTRWMNWLTCFDKSGDGASISYLKLKEDLQIMTKNMLDWNAENEMCNKSGIAPWLQKVGRGNHQGL